MLSVSPRRRLRTGSALRAPGPPMAIRLSRRGPALLALAMVMWLSALVVATPGVAGSPEWHLHLVQVREIRAEGTNGHGLVGPYTVHARFSQPTQAGDLLVAAIVDGVITSGMPQPGGLMPGWTLGRDVIGGNTANGGSGGYSTGGLQVAIYFYPDNPGGIVSVPATKIASGSVSTLTILLAEISGAPRDISVDVAGSSTSGPTTQTDSTTSTVYTDTSTHHAPDLVLAAFDNGGNAPQGETFFWSRGWTLIGKDTAQGNIDQPVLFDYRVLQRPGVIGEQMHYVGGYPIDNCAAIVALS